MMTSSVLFPSSRQAFAFARDGALPFSKWFYQLNRWTGTPVRTVWLVVVACIPLGALGFADPENGGAVNAIFSLSILGPCELDIALFHADGSLIPDVAYSIPILCRLLWGEDTFHVRIR